MKIKQKGYYTFIFFLLMIQHQFVIADPVLLPEGLEHNQAVSLDELDDACGMGGVVDITTHNNIDVNGMLNGNTAINNNTGTNNIDNGAFTDAGGFISVIQNTGNNVLIQETTLVNINVTY
ncbi:MAG: hypothetical protein V3U87_11125 [Methylococcaceae bacterium]